jgi:hypothetical protein
MVGNVTMEIKVDSLLYLLNSANDTAFLNNIRKVGELFQ